MWMEWPGGVGFGGPRDTGVVGAAAGAVVSKDLLWGHGRLNPHIIGPPTSSAVGWLSRMAGDEGVPCRGRRAWQDLEMARL
jgi:hypothetical protein